MKERMGGKTNDSVVLQVVSVAATENSVKVEQGVIGNPQYILDEADPKYIELQPSTSSNQKRCAISESYCYVAAGRKSSIANYR